MLAFTVGHCFQLLSMKFLALLVLSGLVFQSVGTAENGSLITLHLLNILPNSDSSLGYPDPSKIVRGSGR